METASVKLSLFDLIRLNVFAKGWRLVVLSNTKYIPIVIGTQRELKYITATHSCEAQGGSLILT